MSLNLPQKLAVAEFFAKHFATVRKEQLNPEAVEEMAVGERYAAKFDGNVAAWVSLPKPAQRASVKNEDALLAWAKEHIPQAVETVERVRPDTVKRLQDEMKRRGGWLDRESGEIVPVDGIEVSESDPSPRVQLEDGAARIIADAWRAGDIDLGETLAVEPAPESEAA